VGLLKSCRAFLGSFSNNFSGAVRVAPHFPRWLGRKQKCDHYGPWVKSPTASLQSWQNFMNDETVIVLKAINDLTKEVSEHNAQFREFRGEMATKVKSLEEDSKSTRTWQKIQAICVVPVVGGIHQVASYFHWIK
jgi:hypothetical protein